MIRATTLAEMHQRDLDTFGPGRRTWDISKHIEKGLAAVRADPTDLGEWVDVIILGLVGACRCVRANVEAGGQGLSDARVALIVRAAVAAKVSKIKTRQHTAETPEDHPIEHVRGVND